MEISFDWLLKLAAAIGFIYILLSLFNVHWLMRVRILAAMGAGLVILGFIMWNSIAPADPLGAVTLYNAEFSTLDAVLCAGLAVLAGAGGYLIAYPCGSVLGLLAVPTGMAFWALRSGPLRNLLLTNSSFEQRTQVYAFLQWESLFWLLLVGLGALGVWLAGLAVRPKKDPFSREQIKLTSSRIFSLIIGLLVSAVVALFAIRLFAQDVRYADTQLGFVIGQPGPRQVAFAVFAAFFIAAGAIRYFLDCGTWTAILAAPVLYFYMIRSSCSPEILQYMTQNWAVTYFPNALCAILPIQMMSFSVLGSISGTWLAQKYKNTKIEI